MSSNEMTVFLRRQYYASTSMNIFMGTSVSVEIRARSDTCGHSYRAARLKE